MRVAKPIGKSRLELNHTIFYIATIFLYAGAISGTVIDLKLMDPFTLAADGMAFVVFTIMIVLAIRRKVSFGMAMLVCFIQTCFNFLFGAMMVNIGYPNHPDAWIANPQFLILFSLFGIVSGISVHRMSALIFGFLSLLTMGWFALSFKNSDFYRTWFVLDASVIMGSMFMVFYYRTMLESLVRRLDESLTRVHELKEKAESIHEQNKPFVVFGQNTAGLVNDFHNDVLILNSEIKMLRGEIDDQSTAKSLQAMGDAVRNLNQRIEWVKYVASASPQRQEEMIEVRKLLESALYPFTLQKEWENIQFSCEIPDALHIQGYRRWFLQAIENLIRNSCESGARSINIVARVEDGEIVDPKKYEEGQIFRVVLHISDDGVGNVTCARCPEAQCPLCPRSRDMNAYAAAFQMATRAIESLGGAIEIESDPSLGTKVSLYLESASICSDLEHPYPSV